MTKLKQIIFVVFFIFLALGGVATARAQNYFESISLRLAGLSINLAETNSAPSYYSQSSWCPQVAPVSGNTFLIFSGNYYYNNYSNNDYAYYAWQGGEENNYSWQQIKYGDVLYFWTYTDHAPGCGLSIKFTDNSWLSIDYKDQDGVEAKNSNFRAEGKWYERRIDLSNLAGKTIKNLSLVQENNRYGEEIFRCYFDGIKIINNNPQPVYYNLDSNQRRIAEYRYHQGQNYYNYQRGVTNPGRHPILPTSARVEAVYNNPQPVCVDSDGGKNSAIYGATDNRVNSIGSYVQDTCVSKDLIGYNSWQYNERSSCYGLNCFVKEGYCNGNNVTNAMMSCAYGCQNGACLNR
ncbi:MAG: hypothetical protein WC516_02785 [Patescibacteria group bacterium]